MPVLFCRPPDFGDCSMKCQNVKNKASGQRAPILDVLAFHAFRSLRGPAEWDFREGMHTKAGITPCASVCLGYGRPIGWMNGKFTVLRGKLQKYRKEI